jgi:hypothetical protein
MYRYDVVKGESHHFFDFFIFKSQRLDGLDAGRKDEMGGVHF